MHTILRHFFRGKTKEVLCLLLCASIIEGCASVRNQQITSGIEARMQFGYPEPSVLPMPTALWATYYHIWHAKDTAQGVALLTKKGTALGITLSPRDWCMSGLEGTVRVTRSDGSVAVYNYDGRGDSVQVDCTPYFNKGSLINPTAIGKSRWRIARGEFGDGVGSLLLVPYRSIATDRAVIPTGTIVYIPSARGVRITLPSGKQIEHDGYFYASDVGGAIKANHIDVFTGIATQNPFAFISSKSSQTFSAYILDSTSVPTSVLSDLRTLHTISR